jgi:Ca2+-binding RTX toxin-like protein
VGDFQSSDLSTESMSKANITSLSMKYNGNKFSISNISLNALTEFNSTTDTDFDESFFQRMLSGSDLINGGAGNDWLIGYGGKDTLDGGTGSDTADYSDKTTAVVVNLNKSANATVYINGAAEDTIKNIENITGGSGADQLTGDALTNTFIGGSGNDVIDGGADTAADVIDGGAGTDTISFASITGTTGVTFAIGTYNASTKATAQTVAKIGATLTDKVSNVENITGSKNADVLAGNDANNVISGGSGADTLTGGKGLDKLYGGRNDGVKDIFDFNAANESTSAAMDLIYDFVSSKDKIDLSSMTPSTNNKGAFLNNPATALGTTYKANSVWITKYDTSGTANDYVIVSADLDGKAGADFAVKLIGINNIATADILL